jgi:O-antigen ligase
MLGMEFYQLHEGVSRLQSLGYVSPRFNYYTAMGTMRPFSTFLSPVEFRAYLAIVLGFLVWIRYPGQIKVFKVFLILLGLTGLLITQTRGAWLSFPLGFVTVFFLQSSRTKARLLKILIPIGLLTIMFILYEPSILLKYADRFNTIFSSDYTSNHDRLMLWGGTIQAAEQSFVHFLAGYGDADFTTILANYIPYDVALFGHAHNTYLELLFKYGAAGLVLYLTSVVRIGRTIRKISMSKVGNSSFSSAGFAALSTFCINFMFDNFWTSYNFVITIFLLVGIGLCIQKSSLSVHDDQEHLAESA